MADNKIEAIIEGNPAPLQAAMNQSVSVVQNASAQIKSSLNEMASQSSVVGTAFSKMGTMIAAAISVAALKNAISTTREYYGSVRDLSQMLGIESEAASNLNVALKLIGKTSEDYISVNMKLARQIKTNEDSINQLGVATRGANGALLSQTELFNNAVRTMMTYKEGTDRNQFALYAFGRGAKEVLDYQRLTNQVMQEATRIAKEWGLVVGDEAKEKMRQYGIQLNTLGIIVDAVKIKIGSELIPSIVQLTGYLSKFGAYADVITYPFKGAIIVFDAFVTVIIKVIHGIEGLLAAFGKLSKGEFQKALNDLKMAYQQILIDQEDFTIRMGKLFDKTEFKMPEMPGPTKGTKTFVEPFTGSMVPKWRDELQNMMIEQKRFQGLSVEEEKAFWEKKLAVLGTGLREGTQKYKDALEIRKIIFDLEGKAQKQEADIAVKQQEGREAYVEWQKKSAQELIEGERAQNEEKVRDLERELELNRQSVLNKQETNRQKVELGVMSVQEEVTANRILQHQILLMEEDTYGKILELYKDRPEKYKEMLEKIKGLEQKHDVEVSKIEQKGLLDIKEQFHSVFSSIGSAIQGSVMGIIQGTQTIAVAFAHLGDAILSSIVNAFIQMGLKWVETQLMMMIFGKATQTAAAASTVASDAARGAAAAWASTAAIPIVGPVLAPAAAAEAFAGIMSFMPMAAAAGGWDVDREALTVLHPREMVLPAGLAEGVRGMAAGKTGPGTVRQSITIRANDVRSFSGSQGRRVFNELKKYGRNLGVKR